LKQYFNLIISYKIITVNAYKPKLQDLQHSYSKSILK